MFGLTPDTLCDIKTVFAKLPQIDKVILYGSRAKGNYRKGSDIDITLTGKNLNLKNSVYPLIDKLDELYLPYKFDISILKHIDNHDLIEHINRVGKVFYKKEKGLPDGWQVKALLDCIDKVKTTKKIPKKDFLKDGTYPIISQEKKYLNGYWNNDNDVFKVKKPLIIFGDHTKNIKYVDFDFVLGADGIKILIPKQGINSKFFFYWMKNISLPDLGYARHYRLLKKENINIPPLTEQKAIVKKLDACFSQINQAKTNLEQNLQNTKDLFQSTLTQIFQNPSDDWQVKALGNVCEYDKQKNNNQNLPYVGLEHIEANTGKFIGTLKSLQVKSSTFHFSKNHLLYGRLRPYLNKVLLPNFEGHCSTEIFPIKVNELATREFIFYWLISEKIVKNIDSTSTGARMPRANMKEVINFPIPIPPLAEQKTIVKKLNALSTQTKTLEQNYQNQLKSLADLKKSLLEKAFNGELNYG